MRSLWCLVWGRYRGNIPLLGTYIRAIEGHMVGVGGWVVAYQRGTYVLIFPVRCAASGVWRGGVPGRLRSALPRLGSYWVPRGLGVFLWARYPICRVHLQLSPNRIPVASSNLFHFNPTFQIMVRVFTVPVRCAASGVWRGGAPGGLRAAPPRMTLDQHQ